MPFAHRTTPDSFLDRDWDDAWARGWFRMRQNLFTTHFLEFDRKFHSAVWLRVGLADLVPEKAFLELKKRNRRFRAEFRPCGVSRPTSEQEALYQRYRNSLEFEPAPTLKDLLFGDDTRTLFPTWQVELFDGDTLVAAGFFDAQRYIALGFFKQTVTDVATGDVFSVFAEKW